MHSSASVLNCVKYSADLQAMDMDNDRDENEFLSFLPLSYDILRNLEFGNLVRKKKKVKIGINF